jgi:hypothetical protein
MDLFSFWLELTKLTDDIYKLKVHFRGLRGYRAGFSEWLMALKGFIEKYDINNDKS